MRFVHDLATPRVIFGPGTLAEVAAEVAALGAERVVLMTGRHDSDARGIVDEALAHRLVGVFDQVVEHVPVEVARAATAFARSRGADLLMSLGGGSAIGTVKAVARADGLPILAVPTTYAGSEMTPIWGTTDGEVKRTGRDTRVLPRTVVYDPELTWSMPRPLTASSGMNAVAHCVEAIYAPDASPLVRIAAVEAVRALGEALPRCVGEEVDPEARELALYGAWLAGLALGNAAMGIHHKLCHVLGGIQRLSHGALHSALLPYAAAYNREAAEAEMGRLATALGCADAAEGLWDLGRKLGAPRGLAELGFDPARSADVVDAVLAAPPPNPRPIDASSVSELLELATAGEPPRRTPANA